MTKVSETSLAILAAEHDRLLAKAKRQSLVAQASLDAANALGKTIKELKPAS